MSHPSFTLPCSPHQIITIIAVIVIKDTTNGHILLLKTWHSIPLRAILHSYTLDSSVETLNKPSQPMVNYQQGQGWCISYKTSTEAGIPAQFTFCEGCELYQEAQEQRCGQRTASKGRKQGWRRPGAWCVAQGEAQRERLLVSSDMNDWPS